MTESAQWSHWVKISPPHSIFEWFFSRWPVPLPPSLDIWLSYQVVVFFKIFIVFELAEHALGVFGRKGSKNRCLCVYFVIGKEIPQACVCVVEGVLTPENIIKWFLEMCSAVRYRILINKFWWKIFLERDVRLKWRKKNNVILLKKNIYIYIWV